MGSKDKKQDNSDYSSQEQFSDDGDDQLNIEQEVQQKIKQLSTLKQKVHAIAINHYLSQKRNLDAQLQRQIQQIQQKFRTQYNPFINEMNKIINGQYQFSDIDFQQAGQILTGQQLANKDALCKKQPMPEYWLKVFLNSDILGEQVKERDEPLLKHLVKIEAQKGQDLKRLSIYFYFTQNQWFSNNKLAKHFDIEGDEIKKSHGDQINWKQGKNITVKIVKKKGKKGAKKTKEVRQQSFFNFFRQVQINEDEQQQAQNQSETDQVEELQLQYQMAEHIYQQLVPKGLQFYLDLVGGYGGCCGDQGCTTENCKAVCCDKPTKKSEQVVQEQDDQ